MGTGFLSAEQIAAIKAVRARAWNRDFTVVRNQAGEAAEMYDDPTTLASGTTALKGDWAWRGQQEFRGGPGGLFEHADLMLATDILHSGALVAPGARLVVDGITCAITRSVPYQDHGEIVVGAVRVT
jgi:hypothetical protein